MYMHRPRYLVDPEERDPLKGPGHTYHRAIGNPTSLLSMAIPPSAILMVARMSQVSDIKPKGPATEILFHRHDPHMQQSLDICTFQNTLRYSLYSPFYNPCIRYPYLPFQTQHAPRRGASHPSRRSTCRPWQRSST